MREIILTIHTNAPSYKGGEFIYYSKKGKKYTKEEYYKMINRKELIKELIKIIVWTVIFAIFVVLRAYVFFEYGV